MSTKLNRRLFLGASAAATGALGAGALPAAAAQGALAAGPVLYGPPAGVAKLNANENPFGPSPAARVAMMEAGKQGAYYVGASVRRLKAMIAERHDLTPDHISLSSGSSGVLSFFAVAKSRGGKILAPDLFWDTTAKFAERQGGQIVRTAKVDSLAIDLKAMMRAIDDDISLVHITNPNNPTGLTLDGATLRKFCVAASKRATVLVDEAYNELTDSPDDTTMVPLVRGGHDVVVARTFSKIYGMAGMRVGYMIASPENTALLDQYGLGDYAMNQAGVAAAIASYNDFDFLASSKAKIIEARDMVVDAVRALGLRPLPSQTNFVFVDLGAMNADAFRALMATRGVLIRGVYRDYHNWSRVSMGYPDDVKKYVTALPQVVDALQGAGGARRSAGKGRAQAGGSFPA